MSGPATGRPADAGASQGHGSRASAPSGAPALELRDQELCVERRDQVLERLGAGLEHLDDALRRDLAGEAIHDDVDLLLDQLLEVALVAKRVVDREPDLLVVAAGAEAADRLDDLHVRGRVAAGVSGENLE